MQDVYQLTVADLEMSPMDISGFWYCGKAISLAKTQNNTAAANAMTPYCKAKYKRYHGGDDGWDELVASTATGTAPAANFASNIKPAPTACDMAVQAVDQNDPKDLSFSDKEFILSKADCSPANKLAADKVWQSIQDMEKNGAARLEIAVKVISANEDSLEVAVSDDNQQVSKADMHVVLEKPILHPPAVGSMMKVVGVITDYKPEPFMFVMSQGELPAAHQ